MKKQPTLLALFLGAALLVGAGCSAQTSLTTSPSANTTSPVSALSAANTQTKPPVGTTPSAPSAETYSVSIQNFSFNPQTITVGKGDTVVWTNLDAVQHQVSGNNFEGQPMQQGDTYRFTFTDSGTYDYICKIHPSMKGTVIVK